MQSTKLNEWIQIAGIFLLVASLLFVGFQIQQEHEIARSTASQSRAESTAQHLRDLSANPYLMSAFDKIGAGKGGELLPSEQFAIRTNAAATLYIFDNIHYQYEEGYVDEERWQGAKASLKGSLSGNVPGRLDVRSIFESNPDIVRESFRSVVNDLLDEIDSEPQKSD